jgi:hypothetical protein
MMEAVSTSETTVCFYLTTQRNIPEDSNLQLITPSVLLTTGTINSKPRTAVLDV